MNILSDIAVRLAEKAAAKKAVARAVEAEAPRMAVKIAPKRPALPAPPKRLALPAPKPKPDPRFKPRGGQWLPDKGLGETDPIKRGWKVNPTGQSNPKWAFRATNGDFTTGAVATPEQALEAARASIAAHGMQNFSPEAAVLRDAFTVARDDHANWLQKALLKYYKNDFGTEADPLRDLAAKGLHYDSEMTPDKWVDTANGLIREDPIGYYTVPSHWGKDTPEYDPITGPQVVQAAPWLTKQPVTDPVYGLSGGLDLDHFNDEMHNALYNAEGAGLPPDLAVRPESLQRMSFPQAVEHVGRINQFRAKQMEAAQAAAMNNPAIHLHKDYGDGMRWVELKHPGFELPENWSVGPAEDTPDYHYARDETGSPRGGGLTPEQAISAALYRTERDPVNHLQDALRHEGDTMGHCVGGYCDDVVSGRSRIFSLRDAKGQPHVTVETSPGQHQDLANRVPDEVQKQIDASLSHSLNYGRDFNRAMVEWAEKNLTPPDDIVQIKGKQNRAPNDEYLPYVQDFVKSGQWGNIGDLGNSGLVKLPDGRYITKQQHAEALSRSSDLYGDEPWDQLQHLFKGYAYGGRVNHTRDFARNPLAVGRG